MAFSTLGVDLVAKIGSFEEGMNRAVKSVDSLDRRFGVLGASVKGFVGALSVGAIASFAKHGIDAADAMQDMADRTGVSVRTLAEYQLAATQADTSLESLAKGIQKLSLSIGQAEQGSKEQAAALTRLGVTARDPQQAFEQLADAVASSNDPIRTNADLQKVLGKNYAELLPLLQQGSNGLRESAAASEDFADAMVKLAPNATKFNDQLDQLKLNAAAAAGKLLAELVPALNRTFERFEDILRLRGAGASLFEIITGQVNANVSGSLREVNIEIASIEGTIERLRRNSGGKDQSIIPLTGELERLKALRAEMQAIASEQIMRPPPSKSSAAGAAAAAPGDTIKPQPAARSGRSSARQVDQLASILGQTDTARSSEYEKLLGLIEKRYASGKIKAQQFGEAVAVLNKQFNREQIDVFENGSFVTIDPKVAEFIREQTSAFNELSGAIAEDGVRAAEAFESALAALLSDTHIAKTEQLYTNIQILDKALFDGVIGAEQHAQALEKITTGSAAQAKEMDEFAKEAARGMQDAFADFLFDPFDKGLDGMIEGFGKMIQRMIAEAVAADLARNLFGDLVEGGNGSGLVGGALSFLGDLMSFDGGGYTGSGSRSGGVDGKGGFLSVLHPNETVIDHARGQRLGGGNTIVVNISGANNAPDVRRAAGQGAREALGLMGGAQRYA